MKDFVSTYPIYLYLASNFCFVAFVGMSGGDGEMGLLAELGVNTELRTMSLMHASFLTPYLHMQKAVSQHQSQIDSARSEKMNLIE
jgi:hypothetical protein